MSSNAGENNYNDGVKGISTDRFSFEYFIANNLLYVDKTMYAYELINSADKNFFFVSRPRRFGKSLFCSTLHSIFDGRRDLFKGLYIAEKTGYSFEKYPVLHFNFANLSKLSADDFIGGMQELIADEAKKAAGITDLKEESPARMLRTLLSEIGERTGKGTVIIIDEYDDPLTKAILGRFSYTEEMRLVLNDFFSVIKNSSEYIRFFFMTGCVRLSNLSIFSAMNNLYDISMDRRFAGAFGYTEKELEDNFGEGMDEYLEANPGIYGSKEEFIGRIRDYYDGYRFSPRSDIKVYNPVSIGRFFDRLECIFENYWELTGVSTMAVELARKYDLLSLVEEMPSLDLEAFTSFDISLLAEKKLRVNDIYALLYYAGYLTIKKAGETSLRLGYPNREISASFTRALIKQYMEQGFGSLTDDLGEAMDGCDGEAMAAIFNRYLAMFPYHFYERRDERLFHTMMHGLFVCMKGDAYPEDAGKLGRADEVFIRGKHIYIFELKVDGEAGEALQQIKDRHYADKYIHMAEEKGMEIILVGLSFSSSKRCISGFSYELYDFLGLPPA